MSGAQPGRGGQESSRPQRHSRQLCRLLLGAAALLMVLAIIRVGRWINHWYVAQSGYRPHLDEADAPMWRDLYLLLERGNVELVWGLASVVAAAAAWFAARSLRARTVLST